MHATLNVVSDGITHFSSLFHTADDYYDHHTGYDTHGSAAYNTTNNSSNVDGIHWMDARTVIMINATIFIMYVHQMIVMSL